MVVAAQISRAGAVGALLQTQGLPALGASGLGPSPELAASSASFVPPPPLPAHLSRRDSDATRSQGFTVRCKRPVMTSWLCSTIEVQPCLSKNLPNHA